MMVNDLQKLIRPNEFQTQITKGIRFVDAASARLIYFKHYTQIHQL